MKTTVSVSLLSLATLCAMVISSPCRASGTPTGQVDFGPFTPPAGGGEYVEVRLNGNILALAARLMEREEPDLAGVVRGLQGIRVNVVGLDDHNRGEILRQMERVRSELSAGGWERVVAVQSGNEDVGVYLKTRADEAIEGRAVRREVFEPHAQRPFGRQLGEGDDGMHPAFLTGRGSSSSPLACSSSPWYLSKNAMASSATSFAFGA